VKIGIAALIPISDFEPPTKYDEIESMEVCDCDFYWQVHI